MYSYIKGTLEEVSEDLIVVENNGIGYNIRISARMLDALPARENRSRFIPICM
ncbi:MAG: OB-fold domain-containing protein [Eubacterium ramulus]